MLNIGKITKARGIKGEVKVIPSTFDISRFDLLKVAKVNFNGDIKEFDVQYVKYHNGTVIMKFKGIDTMDDAEKLKDGIIQVSKDEALALEDDEYYFDDLVGMEVRENGEKIGELIQVLETKANDVYVIKTLDNKEILIPAIFQCIINVDVEGKIMEVKLMKEYE